MGLYGILLIIGSLLGLFYTLNKIRKEHVRIEDSIFWILFCLLLVLMGLFPGVMVWLSHLIGIESPANLVFLIIITLLLVKCFSLTVSLSQVSRKLYVLTQDVNITKKSVLDDRHDEQE